MVSDHSIDWYWFGRFGFAPATRPVFPVQTSSLVYWPHTCPRATMQAEGQTTRLLESSQGQSVWLSESSKGSKIPICIIALNIQELDLVPLTFLLTHVPTSSLTLPHHKLLLFLITSHHLRKKSVFDQWETLSLLSIMRASTHWRWMLGNSAAMDTVDPAACRYTWDRSSAVQVIYGRVGPRL